MGLRFPFYHQPFNSSSAGPENRKQLLKRTEFGKDVDLRLQSVFTLLVKHLDIHVSYLSLIRSHAIFVSEIKKMAAPPSPEHRVRPGYLVSEIPDPPDYELQPLSVNSKQGETAMSLRSNQNKNTLDLLDNIKTMLKIHPFYCLQIYFIIVHSRFL